MSPGSVNNINLSHMIFVQLISFALKLSVSEVTQL